MGYIHNIDLDDTDAVVKDPLWSPERLALHSEKCRKAAAAYEAWQRGEGIYSFAERRAEAIAEAEAWMRLLAEKYQPEPLKPMTWDEFCEEYLC